MRRGWQRIAPLAIALLGLSVPAPRIARAQLVVATDTANAPRAVRLRPVFRVDALFARQSAVHAGAGLGVAAGNYVRLSLEGGAGIGLGRGEREPGASARVDLAARFLLDPYAQQPRGPYAGGGVSVRHDARDGWQPALLVLAGIEGRPRAGWAPSFELGLGRGARLGVVIRAARPERRP